MPKPYLVKQSIGLANNFRLYACNYIFGLNHKPDITLDNNHGREKWLSKLFRILNSAFCFASVYLVMHYVHWVIVALSGTAFDLNAFLYYHGVKFLMNGHPWDKEMVVIIYVSAPIILFVVGLLCMALYTRLKTKKFLLNVYLLWAYVVGVGFFLAQPPISSVGLNVQPSAFYIDWAAVFAWLNIPAIAVYLLNIPAIFLMFYFGANTAMPFMRLAYSSTKINKVERRQKFFAETVILPFIVGALIVLMVGFPLGPTAFRENFIVHGIYLFIIAVMLVVGWLSLAYLNITRDDIARYTNLQALNVFVIFGLVLIAVAIKITWAGIYV